ncbi:MAG: sulfotransferase domain-containing protein [Chloroflexota bacterium]
MTTIEKSARQHYIDNVRAMMEADDYVTLLRDEGKRPNSLAFKEGAFANYQPTAQDVIVSTYPKSGTNWTMQMAQEIAWYGEAEFEHVDSAIPWPDTLSQTPIAPLSDTSMAERSPTGLRVIKSHLEDEYVPYSKEAVYISVVRDPKDVVVSTFHFENGFFERMVGGGVPLDAYVEAFLAKGFIYANWADHVASWWRLREYENVLLLSFEAIKEEPERAIRAIAELMGVELSSDQLAKVVHKSSYAYMKANNHKFSPPTPPDYPEQGQITMIREGQSGESARVLSDAQRQAIDQFCADELAALGSDFPYWERYGNDG